MNTLRARVAELESALLNTPAANEIVESLVVQFEHDRYREALEDLAASDYHGNAVRQIAREALSGSSEDIENK